MRRFTDLYLRLDSTGSTSEKLDALEAYFREAPPADAAWATAVLSGQRPKGSPSTRVVWALAVERAGVPAWLFEACRAVVGDLSETVALIVPDAGGPRGDLPLHLVMQEHVLPLAGAGEGERGAIITAAWEAMDAQQRFVYLKLMRGALRVGVQRRMLAQALARVAGVEQAAMEHRLAGGVEPTPAAFARLIGPEGEGDRAWRPYPFYLAHPIAADAAGLAEALGDPEGWMAEWKWDGVRAQVAVREGAVMVWSRGEEVVTHQFPEIARAAAGLPEGTVLDAEVLLWRGEGPAPFAALQTRLNRKHGPEPQGMLFRAEREVALAFDVLEVEGRDVRALSQVERRGLLEGVVGEGGEGTIRVSPLIGFGSWEELGVLRASSRERGVEGMMLKHRGSPYMAGRVKPGQSPGWVKWKIDPLTVDAVLVNALPGSGRRATLYTDYGFALWGEGRGELVVFARAYSGLTQEEIEELDAWVRRHTRRRAGPLREVEPQRVFEIGFERVARSARHKAGVAVRFPRILRERTDKRAVDADDLAALRAMLPADEA